MSDEDSGSAEVVGEILSDIVNATVNGTAADAPLSWASEWLGYIALCMFSMVLLIPTLGIVSLMVWEYFSDEAERKAERQKEIATVMKQHYFPKEKKESEGKEEDDDDDDFDDSEDERDLRDVDEVLQQAETLLHKRKRINADTSPDNFEQILT